MLKVFLLGAPLVESHGAAAPIARRKGLALLAYLAVEGGPHRRDTLATLLWPDESQSDARSNLRRVLSELNTALGVPVFQADRETIELVKNEHVWIDVAAFLPALAAAQAHDHRGLAPCAECIGRLAAAAELYRADLLAGFSLRDSQGFDEWLVLRAEDLRGQFAQVLELLIQGYRAQGAYHEASAAARRLLALDAFDESVQRTLIELLAVAGHHSAALRQYEECARLLDQELGIAPQPETTALYQQIRSGAFRSRRSATQLEPALLAAAQRALPTPTTPFFGREQELAVVAQALADPHCRLLTILGSGGIGKTRLALHAADAYQAAGQVAFVACVALQSREDLIAAIADAAGYTFYGEDPADQQLLAHLRPRSLVLVCDNFEHLIGHAGVLSSILAAAPQIKILVTSWERLQLSEEWTLPLSGLPLPDPADFASSSAVQIFEHSARRVQPQFALAAEDVAAVARICQLVEGLPLAIELAGAWVRALSCQEIAAEIEACLGFLTSSLRDVPERHRNLRAIFDRSWQLLSEPERAVFRQLAVFRHGFCHPAAQAVAGASLPLLAAFLDKSLLRRTAAGRYESHEFIRQYTEEQLKTNQQEYAAVTARHYAYYAALLADHAGLLQRGDQPLASGVTAAEVENIRAAWAWVLEHGDLAQLAAFSEGLYQFYNTHGWYYEAHDVFAHAAATLEQRPPAADPAAQATLVGRMLLYQGNSSLSLGFYADARALLLRSIDMLRGQTDDLALITALVHFAQLELTVGRYAESAQIMQEVLALSRQHAFPVMEAKALNFLGYIAGSEGRHAEGRRLLEQSLAIAQRSGNLRSQASTLNSLGYILMLSCDYPAARRCLEESLSLKQVYSTPSSDAGTMLNLAYLELRSGAYAKAEGLFQRILRQMLGSQTIPVALDALAGIALIMERRGQPERAFELASVVLRHPSIWNETAVTANRLLASLRAQAVLPEPPDQLPDWRDPALGWQELVNSVLAELEAQESAPLEPEPA